MTNTITWCLAGAFALMGLVGLTSPHRVARYFKISATTPDFRNEIRGVYGGFGIAIAALLVLSPGTLYAPGVRITVACALIGMVSGRLVGFAVERTDRWPIIFCALEALGAFCLLELVS